MKRNIFNLKSLGLLLLTTGALLGSVSSSGQVSLAVESAKIQMAYKNPASLSFDVRYTYAVEADPETILDSTSGTFKISGTYYWGTIDSTEFMQNGSYSIMLYKPDKIMKVNNPTYIYPEIANFSAFDSLIGKNNYSTTFSTSGMNKVITMNFSDTNYSYKTFSIYYDSLTSRVTQIISVMKEGFDDNSDSYNPYSATNTSTYVIVKAEYTNYQTAAFSNTIFNSANYFIWIENSYMAQYPYSDYEVFIASPNLLNSQ